MQRESIGRYMTISAVGGEEARAFIPSPLPPNPPIDWTPSLRDKFDRALLALGRLDGISTLLLDASLFVDLYIRKEAVYSSRIEGTRSTLTDLLLFELDQEPGVPIDDAREVSGCVEALHGGLRLLKEDLPMSQRLLREVHGLLMSKARSDPTPGEFRRSQNWIGGPRPSQASFVPPPAAEVPACMSQLERFLNDQPRPTPTLLKAALAHVQFETIHPFLDGNGRTGRLLIALLLCERQVLRRPMLPISVHIHKHRPRYYALLNNVHTNGDWEAWLDFFAEAVIASATQGAEDARRLLGLLNTDRNEIADLGRASESALRIHQAMIERPIATSNWLAENAGLSPATVNKTLVHLQKLGIVKELTAKRRNRVFSYAGYMEILERDMG